MGAGQDWRVRPIRAANGRVQIFAVEHRRYGNVFREVTAVYDHATAMTIARHLASS